MQTNSKQHVMPAEADDSQTASDEAVVCKELLGGFVATEETYPNGKKYLVVTRGKGRIGNCEKVEGGYLVWNKRKPVESLVLAIKQMIDDGMNKCRDEEAKWRKMMNCLSNECGPLLTENQRRKQQAIRDAYKPGDYDAD